MKDVTRNGIPPLIDDLTAVEVGLLLAQDQSLELIVDGPGDPYLVRDQSKPRIPRAYRAPVPAGVRQPAWKAAP